MRNRLAENVERGLSDTRARIMVDSGAHSLYTKFVLNTGGSGKSFYKTKEFRTFLDGYMEWLHANKDAVDSYVGLDIIHNPVATYEILTEMRHSGLSPIPVVHVGTDVSWLKKYLKHFDYIGFGGLGQRTKADAYHNFGDEMFKYICNKDGTPCVKTHGFAMTTGFLQTRYPWYSVDSTTWVKMAANGRILVPWPKLYHHSKGVSEWSFVEGRSIGVTDRTINSCGAWHIHKLPSTIVSILTKYLEDACGVTIKQVAEDADIRNVVNAKFFLERGEELKRIYAKKFNYEEGGNIFLVDVVKTTRNTRQVNDALRLTKGVRFVNSLSSYYFRSTMPRLISWKKSFMTRRNVLRNRLNIT